MLSALARMTRIYDVFTAVVRSQSLVVADQQRVEKQRHVGAVAAVEITPGNTIT